MHSGRLHFHSESMWNVYCEANALLPLHCIQCLTIRTVERILNIWVGTKSILNFATLLALLVRWEYFKDARNTKKYHVLSHIAVTFSMTWKLILTSGFWELKVWYRRQFGATTHYNIVRFSSKCILYYYGLYACETFVPITIVGKTPFLIRHQLIAHGWFWNYLN